MTRPIESAEILVVEDDALIRDYVAQLLLGSGYRVTCAASSQEALCLIDMGLAPNLLFTDIRVADGMSGIELARQAQRIVPDLKVLFMSGHIDTKGRERLPEGAGFLRKPFRSLQCLEKVRSALA